MKAGQALCLVLLATTVLASCTPKAKNMNDTEIQKVVRETLLQIDPSVSESLCPESYNGGMVGGCYGLKEADDIVANTFYEAMQKKGFTPTHRMRQDYQAWTGNLRTPAKDRAVVFNIRTVVDASKEMGTPFKARELGYQTLVTITLLGADQ